MQRPPVRFVRTPGMLPLPVPEKGGSIETLRSLVNVADEQDFVLVVAWLLAAMHCEHRQTGYGYSGRRRLRKIELGGDPSRADRSARPTLHRSPADGAQAAGGGGRVLFASLRQHFGSDSVDVGRPVPLRDRRQQPARHHQRDLGHHSRDRTWPTAA